MKAAALLLLVFAGCSSGAAVIGRSPLEVAASPSQPSTLPLDVATRLQGVDRDQAVTQPPGGPLSLEEAIRLALQNSPDTRAAWLRARAAVDAVGSSRSAYYPEIDLDAVALREKTATATGVSTTTQNYLGPEIVASALLLDSGGRAARVEEARASLVAASLVHTAAIEDVILRTEQAYYDVLDDKGLVAGYEATLSELKKSVESADARHDAGVATIADVLQARTAESQGELNYDTAIGNLHIAEGALSSALGLRADAAVETGSLPTELPPTDVDRSVGALLDQAVANRPEIGASRAAALRARAHVTDVRSDYLPSLSVSATGGEQSYGSSHNVNAYTAELLFQFPVFTGFRSRYDVKQAEEEARAVDADLRVAEQQVGLQVWTSYYALQTARARVNATRDLLASANENATVANGRYREGVGSILDVLTAESALAGARAVETTSRADWFIAMAQLQHDVGTLLPPAQENSTP